MVDDRARGLTDAGQKYLRLREGQLVAGIRLAAAISHPSFHRE
ncbi:hypothetical protein ATSB10_23430 [Dyella thiooxydans]|uniref:Uncharacterized protein n=1 Tax=Dyella thiooxydans TaxID=445710 RepID=A0A160N2I4_9GAMM|nr:hypothetical protein ATSB10_23430 [Dyella thiooxydans]